MNVPIPPYRKPKTAKKTPIFSFTGDDGKQYRLTLQQKLFCEKYCEFSASSIDAIVAAGYAVTNEKGVLNRNLAYSMATENLTKPAIMAYINTLLSQYGLTDENVDKQLLFLVNQDVDFNSKKGAIDIYYKKKGSYAPEKKELDVSSKLNEALSRLAAVLPKSGE